jgi:hypothetical protein
MHRIAETEISAETDTETESFRSLMLTTTFDNPSFQENAKQKPLRITEEGWL